MASRRRSTSSSGSTPATCTTPSSPSGCSRSSRARCSSASSSAGSSAQAASGTGQEDLFSQLYASVYTSSSLVALAIQSFITSGLLRRIGVAWVLFLLPLWYLATYGWAAAESIVLGLSGLSLLSGI